MLCLLYWKFRDGSDEPGTSACPTGVFHCANVGHRSLNLISSRVNDKICDCCDGSDEWGTDTQCPNTCEEMGRRAREEYQRQQEMHAQGYNRKLEYSVQGKHKDEESRAELSQKEAELETLRAEVDRLAAVRDAAEEPEKAAKDEHQKRWEEKKEAEKAAVLREDAKYGFDQLDTNSDGYVSIDELRTRYELDDNGDGDVSEEEALSYSDNLVSLTFEAFYPSVWDRVADKCQFNRPPPVTEAPVQDQDARAGESDGGEVDGGQGEEDDNDEDDEDDDYEDDDIQEEPKEKEEMPPYDEATLALIETANAARDAFREADNKKSAVDRDISNLKKFLEIDYGADMEFSPLYDQCYEYTDREYTYKMCGFKKVTQTPKNGGRETSLGMWGKWNGPGGNLYSVMVYENGESCWNGPSRSATIKLQCGLEDKLLSASEPNRCEYAMDFSTPAVCTPTARNPHEEL